MSTAAAPRPPRIRPVMRDEASTVLPLELFFDLVFVLALTQCTALMSEHPTWEGLAQGLLLLGVLWWVWVGYAWLTSVVNPDEGAVRIVMFAAMAALLVASLCVPEAFEDRALLFVACIAVVRAAHIALFWIASADDPAFRESVTGLAISTAVGIGILVVGALAEEELRIALWTLALLLDMAGPFFFGAAGWNLSPAHFAERHGLILIIALGESIVAIGVGAEAGVTVGVVVAATLGIVVAAAFWWLYFDVVALVAERRLHNAQEGRERNEIARDSYSYLHLPMVAGIVLVALGMKKTLGDTGEALKTVPAVALLGGTALYLLAHVAFRLRNIHTLNRQRLVVAILLVALVPLAVELPALGTLAILAAIATALIVYEAVRFAEARHRLRDRLLHQHG